MTLLLWYYWASVRSYKQSRGEASFVLFQDRQPTVIGIAWGQSSRRSALGYTQYVRSRVRLWAGGHCAVLYAGLNVDKHTAVE